MDILWSLFTACLCVASCVGALELREWWQMKQAAKLKPMPPSSEHIARVVFQVCRDLGLPGEQLTRDFDLVRTGKVADVLLLSAQALKKDHELSTAGDVIDWLLESPEAIR